MKVILDIPKDFRTDVMTKFQSFFVRVKTEIERQLNFGNALFCGSWEMEEAEMFEKCFSDSVILPDNATNGDVIKALFPNATVYSYKDSFDVYSDMVICPQNCMLSADRNFWNAPYKGGKEDGKA